MKNIKIYVMAHKAFKEPEDKIYVPMQVGAALNAPLGYVADNVGDNISDRNPYYSELTGLYWMWKNGPECDITGLCHYRRFFLNEDLETLDGKQYESILREYDAILTYRVYYLQGRTVYSQYGEKHYTKDLDLTRDAIRRHYPEYLQDYDSVMAGREMHFANMMVTSKKLIDEYAQWLFTILFDVEQHIDMTGYDDYNKRVFGFIAERLVMVWLRHKKLNIIEMPVGLMAEKSETIEVIKKTADMLRGGNFNEVLEYLQAINEKRPDLFYKDSDTKGELAAIYIFAEVMAAENRAGKNNLLSYSTDYKELLKLYVELKELIEDEEKRAGLYGFINDNNLSTELVLLTLQKVLENKEERIKAYNTLANSYLNDGNIAMARLYVELALKEG